MDLAAAMLIGLVAGVASGMIGVGGGILFVPGLVVFLDLSQVDAEATSLVAVVVVAVVGAWRQHGYGNVRMRDAAVVAALSPVGVLAGTAAANALSERALAFAFAAVQLVFAVRLAHRALTR